MKHRDPLHKLTIFDVLNVIFLGLVALVTVFPIWNVLMISLNEPSDTNLGGLYFWFRKFTLQNFAYFFMEDDWLRAMFMSVARTVLGAVSCVLFTAAFSYGVSKKYLIGHKYIIGYLLLTMYISGGMIPKVECCVEAIRQGVSKVFIVDGRVPHAIIIEMLTDEGIGTMFV